MVKHNRMSRYLVYILFLCCSLTISCSSSLSIKPFSTDGCSLFPDHSLISNKDWCNCCIAHDLAYWRGGTVAQRMDADRKLRGCVIKTTGNAALAELMFAGVRAGGGPYYFTSYRWGYGWRYGRDYQPLTAEESAVADRLEREYHAAHPLPACRGDASR